MTRSSRAAIAAALALAAGCSSAPDEAAPRPRAVAPPAGYDSVATEVAVSGEGFRVEPYQSAEGRPAVDAAFRVRLGAAELDEVRWVSERELRARVPAGLAAGSYRLEVVDPRGGTGAVEDAFAVVSGAPPALGPRATLLPALATVGQPVSLRVEVANTGDHTALAVRPLVSISGAALAGPLGPPDPADVAPGATAVFTLGFTAAAPGPATVTVGAEGTDPVTGLAVRAGATSSDAILVQAPASLSSSAVAAPVQASAGQLVTVDVVYESAPGSAGVRDLQPALSGSAGSGTVDVVSAPGPCDVPSGGSCTATFVLEAGLPGDVELRLDAAGFDANVVTTDAPVEAPRATASLVVQRAPALTGRLLVAPARASTGQTVAVTLEVENAGDVAARQVAPRIVAAPAGADPAGEDPAPADVPARGAASFGWTFVVSSPAMASFAAQAAGWDANGAGTVTLPTVVSAELVVEARAALAASSSAAPLVVSAGQPVLVTLDVVNSGEASARVTPDLDAIASGTAGFAAEPQGVVTVAGGETVHLAWSAVTAGAGTLVFVPQVAGVDVNDGSAVAAGDPTGVVTVQRAAQLVAEIVAPSTVSGSATFTAAVDVRNDGEAAAEGVSAALVAASGASALSGPTPPPPVRLAGGATVRFEWTFLADQAPATATFDADAVGTDANSGDSLAASAAAHAVLVQEAATLAAEILSAPDRVNLGQPFEVRVRVANAGDGAAQGTVADVACAGCTADPAPAATTVPARGAVEVSRSFVAGVLGPTSVTASASGVDEIDGLVRFAATVARPLSVEHPAALALVPTGATLVPRSAFSVEVTALNPPAEPGIAQADAREVQTGPLLVAVEPGFLGTVDVSCTPEGQQAATVAAGAGATFRWSCAAARGGPLRLRAEASGMDGNDLDPLFASTSFVLTVDEAVRVADDPFGDGTAFSFVFAYDGHVFLGPSGDGRGVVRCAPDGTGCASFSFRFWRDTTEQVFDPVGAVTLDTSVSANVGCPELVTLGMQPQCDDFDPGATACFCGPDYESGRGMLGAFRLGPAGDEWLVATGRSNRRALDYAYLTRDTASPLGFLYADLSVAFPATAENVIAMSELNGRLYLGLQVESTKGPYIVVLAATPTFPGLDATATEAFGTSLHQTDMGNTGGMSILQVDALLGFEGRLLVANRAAVLVSRNGYPTADAAAQFDECTPLAPASWKSTSIAAYPAKRDVGPADRGVTAMAAWNGRLYLARNTAANVPELWAFTPRRDAGGAFLGCASDRSDWTRIATNFGDAANMRITALFASERYLYAGYDSAGGVKLWRTAAPQPLSQSAFEGSGGCAFGAAGCEPVGRPGFGVATNTRFSDARALSLPGGDQVWATVGSGSSAVQVYRLAE